MILKNGSRFELSIAIGKSRKETRWKNIVITWQELVNRLSETVKTYETYNDYVSMKKDEQAQIKDVGGFVGGELRNGTRKNEFVKNRSIVTLDIDYGTPDLWNDIEMNQVSPENYKRYMSDPIHPSRDGYREWWLPKFEEGIALALTRKHTIDISSFVEKAKTLGVLGVKVTQHNELKAEWLSEGECRRNIYSATKSFTSCAMGFAVQEGLISLDEKLTDAFADDIPKNPDENLKKATVRDLLTMCLGQESGHLMGEQRPLYKEDDWARWFFLFHLSMSLEHILSTIM